MFRKYVMALIFCLFTIIGFSNTTEARPAWVFVSYSDFSLHRNPNQNDVTAQGYYYVKIIATCVNNSADKTVSSITRRSMAFTANAHGNGASLGQASGSVSIETPETLTPVAPGESFRIEYSIPVLMLNDGSVAPLNESQGARLNRFNLKHNFEVN